jgi:ABC-2 type transport system permease protein
VNKLLRAEWIKFGSLRFNWGMLLAALVLDLALIVITLIFFDRTTGSGEASTGPDERIQAIVSPLTFVVATLVSVVAVMIMASEYKSKTVIPTFAAAPIRSEVIAAKGILIAAIAVVTFVVALVLNFIVGAVWLNIIDYPIDVADDHFVQAAGGVVLYGGLAALFGFGLGVLFSNQVLAITLVVAIPAVAEPAMSGFLPDWISRFLPYSAGSALATPGGTDELSAWEGGGVFGLWAVVVLIVAAVLFERRDLGNTG